MHHTHNVEVLWLNLNVGLFFCLSHHCLLNFFIPVEMSCDDTVIAILVASIGAEKQEKSVIL